MSLNYSNPDLKRIMPWAGTSHGPESIVKTFTDDGRCTYLQFMEDTFATGASFRGGGSWMFRSDPNGEQVVI